MYFGVACVVGVVWCSCSSFCSYTRFVLIDNNQIYVNPNLCVIGDFSVSYIFFYVEGVVVVVCLSVIV